MIGDVKFQYYNQIYYTNKSNFSKNVLRETKIRIHNITARAVLKYGSEREKRDRYI